MGGTFFVGRVAELERASDLVARVVDRGEGALLFLSGEPGIGKTTLADAVAALAAKRGAHVAWGRCWEAGGAPAYWPWIQVLRALGHDEDPFEGVGLGSADGAAQLRFRQFDRAASHLKRSAKEAPLAIVLDDLHMADVPSLLMLQFLARDLRTARGLLVIGTYRDAEARLSTEVGPLLAKIAREGTACAIGRLDPVDVAMLVRASSPGASDAAVDGVNELAEGNPLFIHEVLRVRGTAAGAGAVSRAPNVSDELRAVLDEHIARVSPETRVVLDIAAVVGRDIDPVVIAALAEMDRDHVDARLDDALEAGLVSSPSGPQLVFAHMLVRQRLYESLDRTRRSALHWRIGERLLRLSSSSTSSSIGKNQIATAAHHLLEGRSAGLTLRAVEVMRDAGSAALARLAFEDAARLFARALATLLAEEGSESNSELACDLELGSGEALFAAGQSAAAREACVRAADRAKALSSATHLARAALVYGSELATGTVDDRMVTLLADALEALPKEDSLLRARALGRHAAAQIPPRERALVPVILAAGSESIAMARRLGDKETLLYCLHFGGSSAGFLVPMGERYENVREHVMLAEELDRPLSVMFVSGLWAACLRENGRLVEADAAIDRLEHLTAEFPQPHYRWRVPMLRAMPPALDGDFDRSEALASEAFRIIEEGEVRAGYICWAMHRMSLALLQGDLMALAPDVPRLLPIMSRLSQTGPTSNTNGFVTILAAAAGQRDEALRHLPELLANDEHFPWALMGGEAIRSLGDVEAAKKLFPSLREHARRHVMFWGPFGAVAFGPATRVAADVAATAGYIDEARALYEETIAIGERMHAPVFATLVNKRLKELAGLTKAKPPIIKRPTTTTAKRDVTLTREGEVWRVTSSGSTMLLKDGKGLQYLDQLLSHPRSPVHVTQLAELHETPLGDAGPRLDQKAKDEYRRRVEDLRDAIEEARTLGDTTRAERSEREMEAIGHELAAAIGLGGRDRKVGSHIERARINVQRRLRDAIQRITEQDPALGRYLAATIKTGVFCAYEPL